jgi:glycerophosphoryl diester phosphodiesterase
MMIGLRRHSVRTTPIQPGPLFALMLSIAIAASHVHAEQTASPQHEPTTSRVSAIRAALLDAGDHSTLVVAHRGHHRTAPENSIASIEDAIAIGAHMVELDIRKTSDGVLVLMHDSKINRTTTGLGKLDSMSLAELKGIQLTHGIRPTGQRIPTLAEVFKAARGRIMINPDLKSASLEEVVEAARTANMLDHCLFKFPLPRLDPKQIAWLKANPDVLFMPIVANRREAMQAVNELDCPAMELVFSGDADWRCDDQDMLTALAKHNVRLWVNTLGDRPRGSKLGDRAYAGGASDVYRRLIDIGYSMIQSDLPEEVIRSLGKQMHKLN